MKTYLRCLEETTKKYGRGKNGEIDLQLYPIQWQIIKEGTKEWLTQKRESEFYNERSSFIFIEELLEELKQDGV